MGYKLYSFICMFIFMSIDFLKCGTDWDTKIIMYLDVLYHKCCHYPYTGCIEVTKLQQAGKNTIIITTKQVCSTKAIWNPNITPVHLGTEPYQCFFPAQFCNNVTVNKRKKRSHWKSNI